MLHLPKPSKFQMLLVRACKSTYPEKRLNSLFNRFYQIKYMTTADKILILSNVINDYKLCSIKEMLDMSYKSHHSPWEGYSFDDMMYSELINVIRLSHVNRFLGTITLPKSYNSFKYDGKAFDKMNDFFNKRPSIKRDLNSESAYIAGYYNI